MASLVKRGGVWSVVYQDATGRQKWVKGYTSKSETQKLANRLEDEKTRIQRGELDPITEARKAERSRGVGEHIDAYETHLKAKGNSTNHVRYTIADLKDFTQFAGLTTASAITWAAVDRWVISLRSNEAPDSPRTINRRVGSVQAFLRHLHKHGGVGEYVLHGYPKQQVKGREKRKRRALTREECDLLLLKTPEPRKLLYRFALLTGLRYSEIASMTPASFHFDAKTLTVKAADAKNKSRDQTIPLHRELIPLLKALCEGKSRDVRVFGLPCRADAAKVVRKDCRRAGVDTTSVDFHCLRHTFITRLAEAQTHPKILQELARHASLETTLGYYVHFRQADERAAIDGLPTLAVCHTVTNVTGVSQDVAA